MIKSKLYSKYFPIQDNHTQFNEEDKKILGKWASVFKTEVLARECQINKHGFIYFSSYNLDKYDERKMQGMIQQNCFDDYYLCVLNAIIYRHKYNAFLSIFFFPIITKENALSIFEKTTN